MKILQKNWCIFFQGLFDPFVFVPLLFTISMIWIQTLQVNIFLNIVLSTFIGILSGVIGARINKTTEEKTIDTRGSISIRGLILIKKNLNQLIQRTKENKERLYKKYNEEQLEITCLEEVLNTCETLKEEILSSIDNWADIIPEMYQTHQLKEIDSLKTILEKEKKAQIESEKEIKSLNDNLTKTKQLLEQTETTTQEEKQELEEKISNYKEKITSNEKQIEEYQNNQKYLNEKISELESSKSTITIGNNLGVGSKSGKALKLLSEKYNLNTHSSEVTLGSLFNNE